MLAVAADYQPELLEQVVGHVADAKISLSAIAADASGLRLFTSDVDGAKAVLTDNGFFCQVHDVIGIEPEDRPGVLREVLQKLRDADVQIISSFGVGVKSGGRIFVRVGDIEAAMAALA